MKRKRSPSPAQMSTRPSRSPRGARASTRSPKSPSQSFSEDPKPNLNDSANASKRSLRTKRVDYAESNVEVIGPCLNFKFWGTHLIVRLLPFRAGFYRNVFLHRPALIFV